MTLIFDGKAKASAKQSELKKEVKELKKAGTTPKLVSTLVGDDEASKLYLSLKKKAAESSGAELEIRGYPANESVDQLIKLIEELNNDDSVHGIMVQLPLPDNFSKEERDQIIATIADKKDVDGMKMDSFFITPVVKAVLVALKEAVKCLPTDKEAKVEIVGSRGFVGTRMKKTLEDMGYEVGGADSKTENLSELTKNADILISATGVHHLIKGGMVKEGAVVIDVGAPKPDVDKDSLKGKVCFISPVPGGVGPLTISCLLENLVEAAQS